MITKPTLLLDEKKCRKNIETMCLKSEKNGTSLRPHFKTHQSLEIGRWFKEFGVDRIAVSSLEMAMYFSPEWNDITVAFPVNILEIATINKLSESINLNLLMESTDTTAFLIEHLESAIGFFIKVDTGYHRTGIDPKETDKIDAILSTAKGNSRLNFKGFLAHAGHTYKCRSKEEVLAVHQQSIAAITDLKEKYIQAFADLVISVGDTPSCSIADDFSMVDEIRPGNFVFYDLAQHQIGSCKIDQIAVAMACPIVAIHKERNEIVIYGGGVHFSKERLEDEKRGSIYGYVAENAEDGWGEAIPDTYISSLSQEHGIISIPEGRIVGYKVGDVLTILPVHSCMTANLMKEYSTSAGKTIERL